MFFITFNQREIAARTLDDALSQDYPDSHLEIVVLDDGSIDGSSAALRKIAADTGKVKIIQGEHDGHYRNAALWNRCIAAASDETEVFVQVDDVRLRGDFVQRHVNWHTGDFNCIVSGAKFEGDDETWDLASCRRRSLAGPGGSARCDVPATAMWGASLSYPRRLLSRACTLHFERPYDELMTGYGHHEVEFALRLQKAGARTVYDPLAGVFHRNHDRVREQQRGLDREMLMKESLERNATYICRKHGLTALPRW